MNKINQLVVHLAQVHALTKLGCFFPKPEVAMYFEQILFDKRCYIVSLQKRKYNPLASISPVDISAIVIKSHGIGFVLEIHDNILTIYLDFSFVPTLQMSREQSHSDCLHICYYEEQCPSLVGVQICITSPLSFLATNPIPVLLNCSCCSIPTLIFIHSAGGVFQHLSS